MRRVPSLQAEAAGPALPIPEASSRAWSVFCLPAASSAFSVGGCPLLSPSSGLLSLPTLLGLREARFEA